MYTLEEAQYLVKQYYSYKITGKAVKTSDGQTYDVREVFHHLNEYNGKYSVLCVCSESMEDLHMKDILTVANDLHLPSPSEFLKNYCNK